MVSPHQPSLLDVDWSKIPAPADDGAAAHLTGMRVADVARTVAPNAEPEIIGIRPGEKLHEQMVSTEDSYYTYEYESHYKILPAINKTIFSALLDFGYVPAYGKFALFNRAIVHWEGYVSLGVGAFMSQVIPVKPSDPSFQFEPSAVS